MLYSFAFIGNINNLTTDVKRAWNSLNLHLKNEGTLKLQYLTTAWGTNEIRGMISPLSVFILAPDYLEKLCTCPFKEQSVCLHVPLLDAIVESQTFQLSHSLCLSFLDVSSWSLLFADELWLDILGNLLLWKQKSFCEVLNLSPCAKWKCCPCHHSYAFSTHTAQEWLRHSCCCCIPPSTERILGEMKVC